MKSAWEYNVCLILDYLLDKGVLSSWKYEPVTFHFAEWYGALARPGPMVWIPDFHIRYADGTERLLEVKGYAVGVDRTKLRRYLKHYNTIALVIVSDHPDMLAFAEDKGLEVWSYRGLAKTYSKLLDDWRK